MLGAFTATSWRPRQCQTFIYQLVLMVCPTLLPHQVVLAMNDVVWGDVDEGEFAASSRRHLYMRVYNKFVHWFGGNPVVQLGEGSVCALESFGSCPSRITEI